jgi:tetratricopeptide (TPR) repeat protein
VAYSGLLQEQRRVLHAHIVDTMEMLFADRLTEQVERLAHHALRGEVWDKALVYCQQVGEKAMMRSAHREAIGSFEQALSALAHLPQERDTREQGIDLRLALYSAFRPLGDYGRILALATASGDIVLHALANQRLGQAYEAQGDYHRAIDRFEQTVASLERGRHRERFGQVFLPAVLSRAWLAACHAELGTFAEGRAPGAEGLRISEVVAHPGSLMVASWGIGLVFLRQGDLPWALL